MTKAGGRGATGRRTRGHRLTPEVLPDHYDLELQLDPSRGQEYRGRVIIRLRLRRPRSSIELHAADLRVTSAGLESGGRRVAARTEAHPERETIELRLAERVPAGEASLRLDFAGRLRADLRGLYAAASGERLYAFTQLEAADARRFFPCFDEPAMKARFRIAVTTGAANTVLSNAPIERTRTLPGGRKRVQFATTPPLSTYLVALGVGELAGSRAVRLGNTPIRVWHVPGKQKLTRFALETARECLMRLEQYFALPYPYAKLDLVAVPDFEAGAMENAGAVFFRETLLLVDPSTATATEKKRAAEVICHELAHMWYGDLVTMAWWDDLWLNEAFATWMAFHVVDQWKPEWRMWHDFQHHRAAALRLDALKNTHPIHTEVRTPAQATENFDLITYEKGASVVRMIERYLGAATFRKGVRRYIRRHRESNAVAADLWNALAEVAGEPVEPIVRGWIEQEGLPLVALRRREEGERQLLELRQERFTSRPARGRRPVARWPVPWVGRSSTGRRRSRLVRQLLTRTRLRVDLGREPVRFVYGNADEGGFFRPLHSASELSALAGSLGQLTTVERMGLIDHQWALARAERAPLSEFLLVLDAMADETDPDVLLSLLAPVAFLEDRLAPEAGPALAAALRDRIADLFGPAMAELGWPGGSRETEETSQRRAVLVALLGEVADWPPVVAAAERRFESYLVDRRSLDPNLADPVVRLAARHGSASRYSALVDALSEAVTPQERRRFLLALADFREARLVDRTLRRCLGDETPTQDVVFVLARLLANPAARERSWAFVKRRWKALRRRIPPMLATRLVEATPALGGRAQRRDVAAFFRANPLPTGTRALEQALERFDLDAAFCRSARADLERWLAR